MTSPQRWREIQHVLDGALDLAPGSRAAYVTDACGADSDLCDQVVRLMHACARAERTESVLASPAASFAAPMLADLAILDGERRTSLADAVATALAGRYTIERMLGPGGTAVVFVARDLRHDRAVAVKVLARDLVAPSGVERFLQEIRVTARLSHPHVLPVHDSGEVDGLLYFVTPYVEGETLRARLTQEGTLSVPDTIRLLRELADALAFAHTRGVVHRDLKPENILLSGGHAVVADFGIAKALADAAETGALMNLEPGSRSMALGTPAYMAPEQAVGNATTDHRADLYAFGVVAYELLAGVHPFGVRSSFALLMAHANEPPTPLGELRPDLPPTLVALVMACLGKSPSNRPASADAVLAALDEARRELDASRRWRPRRMVWAGLAAVGVLELTTSLYMLVGPGRSLLSRGVLTDREPLVVADFHVAGADSAIGPTLGRMFGRYLGESRVITLMPKSRVDSVLQRMRRTPGTALDLTLAREVAQRDGVRAVLAGDLETLGAGYLVTVRLVGAATGDELASFQATAAGQDEVIPVLGNLGRKLRGKIGESLKDVRAGPALRNLTTSSLEALRKYAESEKTRNGEDRLALLRETIALDSTFAYAYLTLGNMLLGVRHSTAARDSALTRAYQLGDRLTEMERTNVTAFYWRFVRYDRGRAMAVYEAQVARDSTDYVSILNLGLNLNGVRAFARAESLTRRFQRTVNSRGLSNLASAQVGQEKLATADSTTQMLHERRGADDALWLNTSIRVALANLRFDSAASLAKHWRAVAHPNFPVTPVELAASIARVRGRLTEAGRLAAEAEALSAGAGMMPGALSEPLDAVREDLWLRRKPVRALARLDALFATYTIASLATAEDKTTAVLAAALYAAAGRPDRARAILVAVMMASDSLARRATHAEREAALGEIALAEGRSREALAAFRRSDVAADGLPVSACAVCLLPRLARAAERAGLTDSARTMWKRYVSTASVDRVETDSWFLAMAYRRLGHLYAATGDRQKAAEYEGRLAALWKEADPDLRLSVAGLR